MRERLTRLSPALTLEERSSLVSGLIRSSLLPNPPPPLLLDHDGAPIPPGYTTYFPPEEGVSFALPPWMERRVLHGDLYRALREELGATSAEQLRTLLQGYQPQIFRLAALMSAINAQATERIKDAPAEEARYRLEALSAIYDLYARSSAGDRAQHPPDVRVPLPTRAGGFAPADTLYFGQEYPGGALTEALYGSSWPASLVANPIALQIDAPVERLAEFLAWLGIEKWPRSFQFNSDDAAVALYLSRSGATSTSTTDTKYQRLMGTGRHIGAFRAHLAERLSYPALFEDWKAHTSAEIDTVRLVGLTTIDRLEAIIERVDPHAIVAWAAQDERIRAWASSGSPLSILAGPQRIPRALQGQQAPAYVTWLLNSQPWLPSEQGDQRSPDNCVRDGALPDELRAVLPRPRLDTGHPLFRQLGIGPLQLRTALDTIGVRATLDDLSGDEFYTLLLELPARDPEGRSAKSLYRKLLQRSEDLATPSEGVKERFSRQGKLLGRRGNEPPAYFPVDQLYYVDNAHVPAVVRKRVPLLELDRKQGAGKVKRLFGVESYDTLGVTVRISAHMPTLSTADVSRELDQLKPFLSALRRHANVHEGGESRLKSLRLTLCRSATGWARVGEDEVPISLQEPGEMILAEEEDGATIYLVAEPSPIGPVLCDELIADRVGEALAGLLRVEGKSSDFARLVSCKPARRLALLAAILDVDPVRAAELVDESADRLQLAHADDDTFEQNRTWQEVPVDRAGQQVVGEDTLRDDQSSRAQQADGGEPPALQSTPVEVAGPLRVEEREYTPAGSTGSVQLRVARTPTDPPQPGTPHRNPDWVRCQEVAYLVEERLGRFPLRADHNSGTRAPGCDILSFGTAAAREQFRAHPDDNFHLVERFIEVKSSVNERGTVELEGNEFSAARDFRNRYHIYRVYQASSGTYDIRVLPDPLAAETGCSAAVKIDFASQHLHGWRVSGDVDTYLRNGAGDPVIQAM